MSLFSSIINPVLGWFLISPASFIHHAFLISYLIGQTFFLAALYGCIAVSGLAVSIVLVILLCSVFLIVLLYLCSIGFSAVGRVLQSIQPPVDHSLLSSQGKSGFLPVLVSCSISIVSYFFTPWAAILAAQEIRGEMDGYCYVLLFPAILRTPLGLLLGKNPSLCHVLFFRHWLPGSGLKLDFTVKNSVMHVSRTLNVISPDIRIGSAVLQKVNSIIDGIRTVQPFGFNRPSFLPSPRPTKDGLKGGQTSKKKSGKMNDASLLASGSALLGRELFSGTNAENIVLARSALDNTAVRTHIPPSSKKYKELVMSLGVPLDYVPATSAHEEAATVRRAWMKKMEQLTTNSVVLMISPSHNEWHSNPNGLGHYPALVDGLDSARISRPCGTCREPVCQILQRAVDEDRVLIGSIEQVARKAFFYHVDALWLLNIEPNIPSSTILELMTIGEIRNCYSAAHADWRAVGNGSSLCSLTNISTRYNGNKVLARFDGSGDYAVDKSKFEAMFRPTTNGFTALRRTIIGQAESSLLMEIQCTDTGYACPMIPDRELNYLIPIPHPRSGIRYIRVEKAGFDRTMQLYRTSAEPSINNARIAIRQSNVTYSISGTSLTARLNISASDSEFLAFWMYIYALSMVKAEEILMTSLATSSTTKWSFVEALSHGLVNDDKTDGNLFASKKVTQRWISLTAAEGHLLSLDEISDRAYDMVYGSEIGVGTGFHPVLMMWENFLLDHPTLKSVVELAQMSRSGLWSEIFSGSSTVASALAFLGLNSSDTITFGLDFIALVSRSLGADAFAEKAIAYSRRISDSDILSNSAKFVDALKAAQSKTFMDGSLDIISTIISVYGPKPDDSEIPGDVAPSVFETLRQDLINAVTAIRSRQERNLAIKTLLTRSEEEVGRCSAEQRRLLTRLIEEAPEILEAAEKKAPGSASVAERVAVFGATKREIAGKPVPLPVFYTADSNEPISIEDAFTSSRKIKVTRDLLPGTPRTLERLPRTNDGKVSFGPIHEIMAEYGDLVEEVSTTRINRQATYTASSDERGARLITNICSNTDSPAIEITTVRAMMDWAEERVVDVEKFKKEAAKDAKDYDGVAIPSDGSATVKGGLDKCLRRVANLSSVTPRRHVVHIEGLAMAGKSAGIRPLLTKDDLVVVPTNKLLEEWVKEVAELDVEKRPAVLTQHKAIGVKVLGKVILDECYQLDPPHIAALQRCPGGGDFITIGDSGQIANPMSEDQAEFEPMTSANSVVVFPTTFCPFDAAATYLREGAHVITVERNFSGSDICRGLFYEIEDTQSVVPTAKDLCIQGTQKAKATMINRGIVDRSVTAHESQGMRSDHTFIHSMAREGLCPDLGFLGANDRRRWFGVAITRARQRTTFIVTDKACARQIPYADITQINGTRYSTQFLSSGTPFDLYDPITMPEMTFTRTSNPVTQYTSFDAGYLDTNQTYGSMVDPASGECVERGNFETDIDVKFASKLTLPVPTVAPLDSGKFVFNPSHVNGALECEVAAERSSKPEGPLTGRDLREADKIIKEFFDKILDPELFFKLAEGDHCAINRHDREKFLARAISDPTAKGSCMSYAFGKNESSKALNVLNEGAKLKLLAVLGMPPAQLAIMDEVVEALSTAFVFSLRPGIISPYRRTKMDVNDVLGSMDGAFELDLNRQDQSHDRLHVAIFIRFLEMVAKRLGLAELVAELRVARRVRTLSGIFIFLQGCGLGSGDAWTLISNMIMAFSSLLAQFEVKRGQVRLQIGDDITDAEALKARGVHIVKFKKVSWKQDNNIGVSASFTSRTAVTPTTAIPVRIRGVLTAITAKRGRAEHLSYKVAVEDFLREISEVGTTNFAIAHAHLWRGTKYESQADAIENIIGDARRIVNTPFEELPTELKASTPDISVYSTRSHCFANALARCLPNNVSAGNCIADAYRYEDLKTAVCVDACRANDVPVLITGTDYGFSSGRQKKSQVQAFVKKYGSRKGVILFNNHAIAVAPATKLDYSIMKWNHVNVLLHETDESETTWL